MAEVWNKTRAVGTDAGESQHRGPRPEPGGPQYLLGLLFGCDTQPDGRVIGVELDTRAENLAVGNSRQLFGGRVLESTTGFFVAPDSKRWLVAFPVEEPNASPLIQTTNWNATVTP